MISNPVTAANDSVRSLFPSSTFNYAFAFSPGAGYQQQYRLLNGKGYWGKFPGTAVQGVVGTARTLDTIQVSAGWNMIGSISVAVDTAAILQIPPGTVTSRYFRYAAGYSEAPAIVPGKGYWVKAGAAGSLVLSGSLAARPLAERVDPLEGFSSVTIVDANGAKQTLHLGTGFAKPVSPELFELPPQAPEGAFDVRFSTGRSVELVASAQPSRHVITIQSAAFPLTVSWHVAGSMSLFIKAGEAEGREMSGEGEWVIAGPGVSELVLTSLGAEVPKEYSLGQNYPNPFNPSTTIQFGLPVPSQVSVRIYNLLGQKVAEVADGVFAPGYHEVLWKGTLSSGSTASSGVYFYRIEASSSIDGQKFVQVRKMMLMK
jgi:hypothetical protein